MGIFSRLFDEIETRVILKKFSKALDNEKPAGESAQNPVEYNAPSVEPQKTLKDNVVGEGGRIINFPGFEHPDLIEYLCEDVPTEPVTHFESYLEELDDGYMFMWMIQPDGRYWADEDGFGMEKGSEVYLYATLDRDFNFTSKFKIYSVGVEKYFGTDKEEKEAEELAGRKLN